MKLQGSLTCRSVQRLLMVFLVLCVLPGCSRDSRPSPYPIKASVTMDGKPIGPLFVMLYSTTPGSYMIAGTADDKGELRFTTTKAGDGAPAGEYKLVVPAVPLSKTSQEVPEVYRNVGTTPLTFTVEESKNEFQVALDSTAKLPESDEPEDFKSKKADLKKRTRKRRNLE